MPKPSRAACDQISLSDILCQLPINAAIQSICTCRTCKVSCDPCILWRGINLCVCDVTVQAGTAELDAVKEAAEDETAALAASLADTIAELAESRAEAVSLREARPAKPAQVYLRVPSASD